MATQLKIIIMKGNFANPQFDNKMKVFEEEHIYTLHRLCWKRSRGWSGCLSFGTIMTNARFNKRWKVGPIQVDVYVLLQ